MPLERSSSDATVPAPTRFCPRCHRAGEAGQALCAGCGETMADQGFCAVCGRYWLLPEGRDCPKHDVPLGPRPEAPPALPPGAVVDWATVGTFPHPLAAEAP